MDWTALTANLAGKYTGLANSDASETLRTSHATPPDNVICPCAITLLAGMANVSTHASWITGTAQVDVMVLLEPAGDVPRRYAALLRWVGPALTAAMAGNTLGMSGDIAGSVPVDIDVALAGESEVYAGMPWDMVRVRYDVPWRQQTAVTP